jgi:hypothetical protein
VKGVRTQWPPGPPGWCRPASGERMTKYRRRKRGEQRQGPCWCEDEGNERGNQGGCRETQLLSGVDAGLAEMHLSAPWAKDRRVYIFKRIMDCLAAQ